jgi:hypothetical protein
MIEVYRKKEKWRFSYPDDAGASAIPWYDQDGKLIKVLKCGVPAGRVESPTELPTRQAALEYVRELFPGEEVKVRSQQSKKKPSSAKPIETGSKAVDKASLVAPLE